MKHEKLHGLVAPGWAILAFLIASLAFASVAEAKGNCKSRFNRDNCPATSPPPTNTAPAISGSPAPSVTTGQSYSFTPTASDADGNALAFSIVNRPPWASFSSSTGRLSGTPSSSSVGEYIDIRISVTDGNLTATLAPFAINVVQGNSPPTISGSPQGEVLEGQTYVFRPVASDADGNPLTFTISNRPSWAGFNGTTGRLGGTPPAGAAGTYANISIRVSDGVATSNLPPFSITVEESAGGSALLSWQAPTTRTDGSPLTNLAGYRIRYGNASGNYPNLVQIPNGGLTSAVIEGLTAASWYFVVSAYDSSGAESAPTSPVSKTIY